MALEAGDSMLDGIGRTWKVTGVVGDIVTADLSGYGTMDLFWSDNDDPPGIYDENWHEESKLNNPKAQAYHNGALVAP